MESRTTPIIATETHEVTSPRPGPLESIPADVEQRLRVAAAILARGAIRAAAAHNNAGESDRLDPSSGHLLTDSNSPS